MRTYRGRINRKNASSGVCHESRLSAESAIHHTAVKAVAFAAHILCMSPAFLLFCLNTPSPSGRVNPRYNVSVVLSPRLLSRPRSDGSDVPCTAAELQAAVKKTSAAELLWQPPRPDSSRPADTRDKHPLKKVSALQAWAGYVIGSSPAELPTCETQVLACDILSFHMACSLPSV